MTWSVSSEPAPVRRAPAKKPSVCPEESQEQKALFKWWRVYSRHAPHLVMYHIPNGGKRSKSEAARFRTMGVKAGVPDIFLPVKRSGHWLTGPSDMIAPYNGLYIELKRQHGGTVSPAQKTWIAALRIAGYAVEVCKGWEAAAAVIMDYLEGRYRPVYQG